MRITAAPVEVIVPTPTAGSVTDVGITAAPVEVLITVQSAVRIALAAVEVIVADDGTRGDGDTCGSGGGGGGSTIHSFGHAS